MAPQRLLLLSLAFLTISTASSTRNITASLEKAGCSTFASLLVSSGAIKVIQPLYNVGLTLFAPTDEAFKEKGVPDLSKLTYPEQVSLVQYHGLPSYKTKGSFKASNGAVLPTLATTKGSGNYGLTVKTAGDNVTLDTGVDSARLTSTVLDDPPLSIFAIDKVLLPKELFGKSSTPTTPVVSESPAPGAKSPSKASPAAAEKASDAVSLNGVSLFVLSAIAAALLQFCVN